MLVDSHCHLDYPGLAERIDAVLASAGDADVGALLTIGTRIARFGEVLAIAERYPNVFCTVGVHPHEAAAEEGLRLDQLVALAAHPKVVGFGETGLDFFYEHSPRQVQEASFRLHLAAARETGLPVVIHTRDADADTLRILRDAGQDRGLRGVVHCFSGDRQLAGAVLDLGLHISFSGILTFKKAEELRRVAAEVPEDRILVETDAPYLAPVPFRGKPNEPAFVRYTAAEVARCRGVALARIATTTTQNFFRLFSKIDRPCE